MTDGMTHDDAREALEAFALGALDLVEREAVAEHVASCLTCRADLRQLEPVVADLALAARPAGIPAARRAGIRGRLVARASADAASREIGPRGSEHSTPPSVAARRTARRLSRTEWVAIAASAIAVLSVGALASARRERDALRDALRTASAQRGTRASMLDSLRGVLDDRQQLIAHLTGPEVAVMSLASVGPASPTGRMFWDQPHNAWTFVAHRLPAPAAGRAYQLWLVTASAKISAGTFSPDAGGDAVVRATYALPATALAAVAVTDEPAAGSAQPTTAPLLLASSDAR
jgi:hypothetical protein